ncbi:hypothetical protein CONPUDRAFT_85052, partial [Coniophora puteana RWD-64-598 SS2]
GLASAVPAPAQTSSAPFSGAAGSCPAGMQGAATSPHQGVGIAEISTDSASTPRHTYPPSGRMSAAMELSTRDQIPGLSSAQVETAEGLSPHRQTMESPSA